MSNMKLISRVPLSIKKAKNLVKAPISKELKPTDIKGYSYQEEKISYGGIEQRWLVIESTERKKADLKKLSKKILEELMKTNKQLVKLEKEEFEQKYLAELKIKDLTAKLKYHQISDIEITERLNKGQTVVYKIKGKLIENQELIKKHENSCGRFILFFEYFRHNPIKTYRNIENI